MALTPEERVRQTVAQWIDEAGRGSAQRLADAVGVRPPAVTKWVSGENKIPRNYWITIERTFGKKPLTLAKLTGEFDLIKDVSDPVALWQTLHPHKRVVPPVQRPKVSEKVKELETQVAELRALIDDLASQMEYIQRTTGSSPPSPAPRPGRRGPRKQSAKR